MLPQALLLSMSNNQIFTKVHPGILSGFIITIVLLPVSKYDSSFEHIENILIYYIGIVCALLL